MTDDDLLFQQWWTIESPPGTFEKEQCKISFMAGMRYARAYEATQQSAHRTDATEPSCEIARSCYFGQDGKCLRGGVCR